ncbi:MAG: hypothetical protein PHD43_24200, partial [Methylococcales bacterium]|nr:hypothetical protein [Methylococcales bacterium]
AYAVQEGVMGIQTRATLWLVSLTAGLCVLYGVFSYGKHVQHVEDLAASQNAVIEQQAQNTAIAKYYTKNIIQTESEHDKDQATINRLRAAAAGGVRIHFPECPGTLPRSAQAESGQDGSAGLLSNGVDEDFARLQTEVDELVNRCAQLNIDTIRLNREVSGMIFRESP